MVAAAMVGSAALGVVGSSMQSSAAKDAAGAQKDATLAGIEEQRRQYDLARADQQPYRETGVRALGSLEADINKMPTHEEVMSDPGYQFGLEQGQQALDRKAAASGGRVSGAALKAASQYATSYATTGYSAAYQRRQDRLNRLATLAGIGQVATGSSAAAGSNSANAISSLLQSQGDATGAAALAQGNIWGNTTNQLSALGQRWANQRISNPDAVGGGSLYETDPSSYGAINGSDAGFYLSDIRLKTNIRPIGRTARGNALYSWDWKTGGSARGVIAQEVAHIPGAVRENADGFLMVDYSKV